MRPSETELEQILQDLGKIELKLEQDAAKYLILCKSAHKHGEADLGEEMYLSHKKAKEELALLKPRIQEAENQLYTLRRDKKRDRSF